MTEQLTALKSFLDVPEKDREPCGLKQTETLLMCSMLDTKEEQIFDENVATQLGFPGEVLFLRLENVAKIKISMPLAVFVITELSYGVVGNLVLWAYTLCRLAQSENKSYLKISDLCNAFPFGFPKQECYNEIWEAQKGYNQNPKIECDNCIDDSRFWDPLKEK